MAKGKSFYCGIDGEGMTGADGKHRYVLLAYSDEIGNRSSYCEDLRGLKTEECLEWMFEEISDHARLFGYSINYDLTMMLRDLNDSQLYRLFRPELRRRPDAPDGTPRPPWPVVFRAGGWTYKLNLLGSKFSVARGNKTRVIWDVFKFFQGKFVDALESWKVGTEKEREDIARMKDQRGEFTREMMGDVTDYCFSECRKLAILVHKLSDAHADAGLTLNAFHGAGSTTSAMFDVMEIKDQIREPPAEMKDALAAGFFGGRFEHSVLGAVSGPVWSYDISSAYPYEMTNLPCLLHARWEKTTSYEAMARARHALVRYTLGKCKDDLPWAPFPFREESGSIVYPLESGGGWIWREEFLAGERLFDHVEFREAWTLNIGCPRGKECQPFKRLPGWYVERLRIGKEGKGIVLKLGMNGGYGKTAQSVGRAPFQSWAWAGMITSGTRAQILGTLGHHKDWSNLLSIATDGIYSREEMVLPKPRSTDTWTVVDVSKPEEGPKPLGGWERKLISAPPGDVGTVFFARPGMYWPLDPKVKLKTVRARGVGRAVLYNNRARVAESFFRDEAYCMLPDVIRFRGAKTGISADHDARDTKGQGGILKRSPSYGQWEARPTIVAFDPRPKREGDYERRGMLATLTCRRVSHKVESAPYDRATKASEDAMALQRLADELAEQPDADFAEVEEQYER